MPTFHIWTLGCQMNQADSLRLAAGLARTGYTPAEDPARADLAVVNTCAVRQHAEDRAAGRLHALNQRRKRGETFQIAVMGCMVGPEGDKERVALARRFPWVDVWARPQEFDPILEVAGQARDVSEGEFWTETFGEPTGPTAYVPVVHGCDKFCTYCIVPLRRGRERSRPVAEVLGEVRHLAARGVREVTLLGQTVEAYGHDLDERADLATLFEGIEAIEGIARTRFLTSYPKDMTDRIIDAVADLPKVCEHFNIPRAVRRRPDAGADASWLHRCRVRGARRAHPQPHARRGDRHRCDRRLSGRDGRGVREHRGAARTDRLRRDPRPPPTRRGPAPSPTASSKTTCRARSRRRA